MKSITFILGISLIFCLNSCSQDFNKISDSEVNKENLQIAQDFAINYLTKLKNGEYYQFEDEAIDALKNQLTEENQKAVYQQLKDKFGDFKSLEYSETWDQGKSSSIQIFRFKSDFEDSKKKLEVRVVLDNSKKIAGFWIKPWSDMLK
jgi:16S rRNA C967 or C1407 C5-methylase (RsmB/RsmF family)